MLVFYFRPDIRVLSIIHVIISLALEFIGVWYVSKAWLVNMCLQTLINI